MGLELKKGRDGTLVMTWYGRYTENGKRVSVALCGVDGVPPASLSIRDRGDTDFEASREQAENKLAGLEREASQKGHAAHLTERLIEAKTGRKVEYTRLSELAARWRGLGRETTPGAAWLGWCDTVFKRFAEAVPCAYLHEVTPEQAADYVEGLRRNFTRRTANGAAHILKSAFGRFLPLGTQNPFAGGIAKKGRDTEGDTVHRRPFTAAELALLFEAARPDTFLYPLIVTAACTGMRRGDVCRLTWKAVDLRAGVVAVKTSKTGAAVEIPVFAPLREVLETALAERDGDTAYVFPDAARMVKANPDGLTWRFKKLVASVLPDPEGGQQGAEAAQGGGRVKLADVLPEVCEAVRVKLDATRCERVLETLRLYAEGASVRDIEKRTGRARSGISLDLHRAEELSGQWFMPAAVKGGGMKGRVDRVTREKAGNGRARRASVLDWHALRVTWVTLALAAGVPMEVARLVTGHKTVEVVLRHYFKPGREHLRAVLGDKLPDVLTGATKPSDRRRGKAAALPSSGGGRVQEIAAQLETLTTIERVQLGKLLRI